MLQQVDNSKELRQNYRGRELPGFSNYRIFEMILQERVAKLKEPAIESLNSTKGTVTHLYVQLEPKIKGFVSVCLFVLLLKTSFSSNSLTCLYNVSETTLFF